VNIIRKCKRSIIMVFVAFALMLGIPSVNVYAADTYTITFRPGDVGYFALEANPEGDRQVMAEAVAAQEYAGYDYTVTKNGAIKVEVAAGAVAPQAPTYIQTEAGYFVKNVMLWGPERRGVDRNKDYVVDYGKLVDGVEYVVKYVDSASGESIAPVYIVQANIGEKRVVTAPEQIITGGTSVYNLVSKGTLEYVLDGDATKNVFVFSYTMVPLQPIIEEINRTETVTRTEIETLIVPGVQEDNEGNEEGEGNENEDTEENIEEDNNNPGDNQENENSGTVDIQDQEVPLADGGDQDNQEELQEVVIIEAEQVPLSDGEEDTIKLAVLGAGITMLVAVTVGGIWINMRKKQKIANSEMDEE